MNIEECSEKVTALGFYNKYKKIETNSIMIIREQIEGKNYLLPLAHVSQDKTNFLFTTTVSGIL